MRINQSFRYELSPNKTQRVLFEKHAGVARWTWNWALAKRKELFDTKEDKERFTDSVKLYKEFVLLKKLPEFAWLGEVSKWVPQGKLRDQDVAFKAFWRNRKKGVGFPKFKKKYKHDSFYLYPINQKKITPRYVTLPFIGKVKTKEDTSKLRGTIKHATVSREAARWYVSFCVKVERPDPPPVEGDVVGVDLGIKTFATISTAEGVHEKVDGPKPLKKALKRLAKKQRQHAKKKIGSKNRRKSAARLADLHRHVKNKRLDATHKLTTRLAKTKSVIVIESLNVSGMVKNRKLACSISDMGFGEFKRQLKYKTDWYGSKLILADMFFPSSKICSQCGYQKETLSLRDRVFECAVCGLSLDRDVNAAINLSRWRPEESSKEASTEVTTSATASSAESYALWRGAVRASETSVSGVGALDETGKDASL